MNRHPHGLILISTLFFSAMLVVSLAGCTDEDTRERPESIEGYQILQTITDKDGFPTNIEIGETITYRFSTPRVVFREGFKVVPLSNDNWSYEQIDPDTTRVHFNYMDTAEPGGSSEHELRFTGSHHGTFETTIETGRGSGGYSGTFVLERIDTVYWDREGHRFCQFRCEADFRCGHYTAEEKERCLTNCWHNVGYHGAPRDCLEVREPLNICLYQQSCSDMDRWRDYYWDRDIDEASVPCRNETGPYLDACQSYYDGWWILWE